MNKILIIAVLFVAAAPLAAETFQIDPAHSSVSFRVKHLVGKVTGRFNKFDGSFVYEKNKPKAWKAEATIDPASINTDNEKRDGHLRSADFFDVAKCPAMGFKSTKVTDIKGDTAKLHGDLTMHCVTKPVVLDLELAGTLDSPMGLRAGATATGKLNRKEFGIVWNKTLDSGGLMLGEDIEVTIEVEGTLPPEGLMARVLGDSKASEITPESLWLDRGSFLRGAGLLAASALIGRAAGAADFAGGEKPTSFKDITHYNNFYEFGTDKDSPGENAAKYLKTRPWSVRVEGLVAKPKTYDIDDVLKKFPSEERVYRLRCVEAWSAVIPWDGFPLSALLKKAEPSAKAKYVAFQTLLDPKQMPGQNDSVLQWPYVEGLRLDEAMHPLTLLATGIYGKPMPAADGAPIRLVVPWKYGFKSIKSIVSIKLVDKQPPTTWNLSAPNEYGFYSNVNPSVDHPRWSQKTERRLGELFKRPTLMFNGYEKEVASLYKGMDLTSNY